MAATLDPQAESHGGRRLGRVLLLASPLVAAGLLLFSRLSCPLLEPEETRYAEIPRQMLAEGCFTTPVWHGEPYWQKPPLFYWLVMASYQVFGVHDWAARLVPCLAAFATVLVVYAWVWRTAGATAGLCSALALTLSGRFLYQGRMVTLDSLLGLWVVLGLAAGHLAMSGTRLRRRWWTVASLAMGLGVMTKGPVALVLVGGPLGLWSLRRDVARPRFRHWLALGLIVVVIAGPWYAALAIRDAQAAGDFFWLHNLRRFVTPFDHEEPFWFFVPILLIGTLPWSLLAVPLGAEVVGRWRRGVALPPALAFGLLSFVWGFLFLSASGCKRACYITPLLPLWATVLGTFVAHGLRGDPRPWLLPRLSAVRWGLGAGATFLILLLGVTELLPVYHRRFALRGQVRRHVDDAALLPVVCYPRRWDSVSFYLERSDVSVCADSAALVAALSRAERTLVFVKSRGFLEEFLGALPATVDFVPCARQGANVMSGFVSRKSNKRT